MTDRDYQALAAAIIRQWEWQKFMRQLAESRREKRRRRKIGKPPQEAAA